MLKAEGKYGNFNDHHDETSFDDSKKVKLMYTSDFLKSFDRPVSRSTSFTADEDQEQIQQLRYLLTKLKDAIEEHNNEGLLTKMKEILNENEEGQQLLNPDKKGFRIPPLKIPDSGSPPKDSSSPTSPSGKMASSSSSSNIAGIFSNALTPSSSSSSISSMGKLSARSPRGRVTKITPSSSSTSLNAPSSADKNAMKRSPSMPVITKERQQGLQSELKLQKKTKSVENAAADSNAKKNISIVDNKNQPKNQPEQISPRKGIKKSVSMSSIFAQDDKDKTNVLKCTSLEEIVGQIYPLTKYQAGCRFLQKKLEEQSDPQHVSMVFNEVFDHLIELMTDPYGQYLVPKLMKHCDKSQRQQIVTKIAPKIVTFACHTYGIHGVQKILEYLTPEQVSTFVEVIAPSVILLAKDSKGNYLIQSFLKQFPPEQNQFIFDSINNNCAEVASHKVGCTLVNRCIDNANEKQLNELVDKIASVALGLVQDQFGNYVVQHLLATKPQFSSTVAKGLLGHIPELSVQKFSSNVIEKCLQVADPQLYSNIIDELTKANLLELLQDRYANFVIQTALDVADEEQHAQLVKQILPFIHQIKTPYVMHIQKKILQV